MRTEHVALARWRAASRSSSTSSALAYAVCTFMTDWIMASILPSTLCDWSIMNAMSSGCVADGDPRAMIRKQLERVDRADDQGRRPRTCGC